MIPLFFVVREIYIIFRYKFKTSKKMEIFSAGDKIRVRRPVNKNEYPIWIEEMDYMDGEVYTVTYCNNDEVGVSEEIWSLNPKWCTKVHSTENREDELWKWELINSCETVENLEAAIISISDPITGTIRGRAREHSAERMASRVKDVVRGNLPANVLTRSYGIRQQALYLKLYDK